MEKYSFERHPTFDKSYKALKKRHKELDKHFEAFRKLVYAQFFAGNNVDIITPRRKRKIFDNSSPIGGYDIWRIEMSLPKTSKNKSPRVWFILHSKGVIFLEIKVHSDNYNDNTVESKVKKLAESYFEG